MNEIANTEPSTEVLGPLFVKAAGGQSLLVDAIKGNGLKNKSTAEIADKINSLKTRFHLCDHDGTLSASIRNAQFYPHALALIVQKTAQPIILHKGRGPKVSVGALVPYTAEVAEAHLFTPPRNYNLLSQIPNDLLMGANIASDAFRRIAQEGYKDEPMAAFTSVAIYQKMGFLIPEGFEIP